MKNLTKHSGGRPGVSLLEVMIAMGVAIIGLLGVAALVTVAGHRLGEAKKADFAAAYMREVVDRFRIEGYDEHDYRFADGSRFDPPVVNGLRAAVPFCFDPLMVAGPVMDEGTPQLVGTFPHHGPADYMIPRVGPAKMFENLHGDPVPQATRELLANMAMRSGDDLVFERPDDRTLPPAGLFSRDAEGSPVRREFLGEYSWFATLVPGSPETDQYTLSVVVLHLRSPYLDETNEVAYPVRFLYGMENSGGSVVIRDVEADQKFRGSGDSWLFLRQRGTYRAGWYRATIDREPLAAEQVAADPLLVMGDVGGRGAYLLGRDWPVTPGTVDTMATWVRGVVLVAERTVRIRD